VEAIVATELTCAKVERRGPVGLAILNRPEKLNAMNTQLSTEMIGVLDDLVLQRRALRYDRVAAA
jgi:enoyl-CoA hydratase/carnithine racemase